MLFALLRRASLVRAFVVVVGSGLLLHRAAVVAAAPGDPDELLGLCQLEALPADIRGSLQRNFSAWKIQEPTDLSARAREKWAGTRPLACPGIAAGHFQTPRDSSFALLLIPANHAGGVLRLLVFTQQSGQQFYGFKVVEQVAGDTTNFFVRAVATTTYAAEEAKWTFRSRPKDSILLVNSDEKAQEANLYVWSNEAYQKVQVPY